MLLDGVDSGTDGTDIDVLGNIQSLGTAASPITFTAVDSTEAWGEIHHTDADASTYSYTHFTRGGRSPGIGHTGTGPTLRIIDSTATFDQVSVSDLVGKVMWADGGDLTFQDSPPRSIGDGPRNSRYRAADGGQLDYRDVRRR